MRNVGSGRAEPVFGPASTPSTAKNSSTYRDGNKGALKVIRSAVEAAAGRSRRDRTKARLATEGAGTEWQEGSGSDRGRVRGGQGRLHGAQIPTAQI